MDPYIVLDIFREAIFVALNMMSVIVVPGLIVGLLVAFFQAATQINEMSLTFVPKIFVTFTALVVFGPFLVKTLIGFSQKIIRDIPYLIG